MALGFWRGPELVHLQSALGICVLVALAWALSEDRSRFSWRMVVGTLLLQAGIALLLLKLPVMRDALFRLNGVVTLLSTATAAGTSFIFGYLGGGPTPFTVTHPANMINLAFGILPLLMVISALSAILWHWRVLPVIVHALSLVLRRTLGLGGAVGLSAAATVFLGNIEGQLVIRPYLARLARTELFILMTVGLSVTAGTVFVLYATILIPVIPDAAGHIAVCSMLGAPAAILISLIMVPDPAEQHTGGKLDEAKQDANSTMDAIVKGTGAGLELLLNIVAMLIVFVALVYLANAILGLLPDVFGAPLTMQRALGWIMAPVCWLLGIPWSQAVTAGGLMGIKTILNELVAYLQLAALPPGALDPRSRLIMLYAMCGFANFGSLGIMIAGLSTMCPQKRDEVISLGLKSIVSGTLTTCLLGAIVGVITP